MADYSDVLDEATLALISEIDQVHRSEKPQDAFKYVNSLMSFGRHLQLQEFRSWLNHKCGLPITVRPSDVDLKEYMDTEQIEAWIHEWTQQHATDRSGRMLSLFLQHEFQVNVKDTMKPCNGCDQPYSTFLLKLMPMRTYKEGTYDPSDYHLFCYTCCTTTSGLLSPGHWLREHPEHQAHQRLLAFSRALQEHRQLTKQHPTPFVQSLIKNGVIRSITRGTGPTAFKDSFEVELLNRAYDLNSLRREPHHWSEDPSHSRDATLICCWWLIRGIEAAAASTKHVWHQNTRDEHTTFITLPVQKNDTTGACVSRGHSCLCRTAPHLRALCPHHAISRHLATLRHWFPSQIDLPTGMPLIPGPDGQTISQTQIVQIFRDTIQRTGTTMERPGPSGEPLHRFSQHSCRVSGAQFLTRLGYSVEAVQLIGRWGSDAIRRYIQEAPLQLQHIANPRSPQSSEINNQQLRNMVQQEVQALQHQFWVVNPMTKVCHVPAVPETCIDNSRWVTLCGWNYGTSLYRKQLAKPTTNYCIKCSFLASHQDLDNDSEDDA